MQHLTSVERAVGRKFDLVYHYQDINGSFPDATERAEARGGRLLHVSIAARDFQGGGGDDVSWASVARGDYDASLRAQARGVASLRAPVFVTFAQEANARDKLGVDGTAAEFKAAWSHLRRLYQEEGATNAVWTWVMTGARRNLQRAAALWPGNGLVDWISWNVYNGSGCTSGPPDPSRIRSFEDQARIFYQFVHEQGPSFGMDPSKPMMISEAGSVRYATDPSLSADWYAAIPSTLRKYPRIKAVTLWDSVTRDCDFQFDTSPTTTEGVRRAGLDPVLDIGEALSRPPRP